jgi:hypothetical protein
VCGGSAVAAVHHALGCARSASVTHTHTRARTPPPQVDQWLQPYLQLALSRLTKAQGRLLKDELLVFVANALYYNAGATMALLGQFGATQQLFALWFGFIFERRGKDGGKPAHFRSQAAKKQVRVV